MVIRDIYRDIALGCISCFERKQKCRKSNLVAKSTVVEVSENGRNHEMQKTTLNLRGSKPALLDLASWRLHRCVA